MKKRLLCLLLCLVTLASLVLSSCSKDNTTEEDISGAASENAITLSMWVVSEKEVSDTDAKAVSYALNQITKSKFKVQLVVNFLTPDVYEEKLSEAIVEYEATRKEQIANEANTEAAEDGTGTGEVVTDEMVTDDLGLSVIKYPELLKNQVDIIYIGGENGETMYMDFINKGWLAELDSELSTSSKKIKEYVSGTLLSAAKINGTTYAIPNNRVIGEYTYMMLNKELVEKYSQKGYVQHGHINGLFNEYLYTFMNMVYKYGGDEVPMDDRVYYYDDEQSKIVAKEGVTAYEECLKLLAHYWTVDPVSYEKLDDFSIFGSHYKNMEELTRGSVALGCGSLFEDKEFAESFLQLNKFRFGTDANLGSYFAPSSADAPTAVKFVTGTSSEVLSYNKNIGDYEYVDENGVAYYPIVVKYPTATTEDIYGNMFGVCKLTRNLSRSMDIITYLNTNSDFRNILQYGVDIATIDKNTADPVYHYELREDENQNPIVHRLNDHYMMNIESTGNMFVAYPEEDMTADIWESGKVQNRDSLVDPMLGLDFAGFAASTVTVEEPTIPSEGFLLSHATGYSKDALSENETIAAWLQSCDESGKGVYILPTEVVDGQTVTAKYYVYNNDVSKESTLNIETIPVVETQIDKKGKPKEVRLGTQFSLSYANIEGGSSASYALSVVELSTKKSQTKELLGNGIELKIAETKSLIDFDVYNTSKYSIEIYDDLSRNVFVAADLIEGGNYFNKNEMIAGWIAKSGQATGKNTVSHVMVYEEEVGDKVAYTVILYRDGMKYLTKAAIVPSGDGSKLNIAFNLTDTAYSTSDEGDKDYHLTYVRVLADKGTELSYTVTYSEDKKDEGTIMKRDNAVNETVSETDPNFVMMGTLDTEMVKFLDNLNRDVLALINACTSYEEMENLVIGLQALLVTDGAIDTANLTDAQMLAIKPLLYKLDADGEEVENYSLQKIATYLKALVATDTITPPVDAETGEPYELYTEQFVFFDSPNVIYYKWLTANGFKPAEQK